MRGASLIGTSALLCFELGYLSLGGFSIAFGVWESRNRGSGKKNKGNDLEPWQRTVHEFRKTKKILITVSTVAISIVVEDIL